MNKRNIIFSTNEVIGLGIDIWRLEEKTNSIDNLNNQNRERINVSLSRIKNFLYEKNIEIKGYVGEKYSDEVNVYELKGIEETNEEEKNNIIKDTIEPAVFIDGNIVKPAKVIIYKLNS